MTDPRRKVLVVGDDAQVVSFVCSVLEQEGCEAMSVDDGSAGASWARRERPDLIVLDVYTARHPGLYTLRDLKLDPRTRDIPVILLTVGERLGVSCSSKDLFNCIGARPELVLQKPVDAAVLWRAARELLARPAEAPPDPAGSP